VYWVARSSRAMTTVPESKRRARGPPFLSTTVRPRRSKAPPEPFKLLLLGFLCLLGLLRCLLLRFLSHSILVWVNGWKRDSEACSGRASLATASIHIRTDSLAAFPRRHGGVMTLSTAVLRFWAFSSSEMTTRRKSRSSCPASCRASTSFFCAHEDVDGRDKPGHDGVRDSASRLTSRQRSRDVYQFKTTSRIAPIAVTNR
jgi:hypothetical protein